VQIYFAALQFSFSGQMWSPADDGIGGEAVAAHSLGFVRPGHPNEVHCCLHQGRVKLDWLQPKRGAANASLRAAQTMETCCRLPLVQVLPIDACWLQDAAANKILAAVKAGIADAHLQL
jgi:hypothetical protein